MRMHILFYLKHFLEFAADLNEGTTKAVHGLAGALVECGAGVSVLCEGADDSSSQAFAGYQIECFRNPCSRPSFRIGPGLKLRLASLGRSDEPVLVVLNGIFHPSLHTVAKVLRRNGVPYVAAPHDPYQPAIFRNKAASKWLYWYAFERPLLAKARAVQVLDRRHEEWLRRLGVGTTVVEVPNGYSPEDILPESDLQWDDQQRPARFCHWGRLDVFNKGIDILIEAFSRIAPKTDAVLDIGGPDDGDGDRLRGLAEPLVRMRRLRLEGPDFTRPTVAILAGRDVVCLPSRFEGFSLVALEAMLAARVLLVSEDAGIAPHVTASRCGVVVKAEVEAVASGMLDLLSRRAEWRDMGLRGRAYAIKQLQWHAIARRALSSYEELTGCPTRSELRPWDTDPTAAAPRA